MADAKAPATEVPLTVRDTVEEHFAANFVLPQTSVWRWDGIRPYLPGQRAVCGWVNFQSASHVYVGFHQFYAIVDSSKVVLGQIASPDEDNTGMLAAKLRVVCDH